MTPSSNSPKLWSDDERLKHMIRNRVHKNPRQRYKPRPFYTTQQGRASTPPQNQNQWMELKVWSDGPGQDTQICIYLLVLGSVTEEGGACPWI